MNMEWKMFTQEPDAEEQAQNRAFLREGLRGGLLVSGSVNTVRRIIATAFTPEAYQAFSDALSMAGGRCCNDEYLGSVELYENGLNMFCKQRGLDHAVGVWRWRWQGYREEQ